MGQKEIIRFWCESGLSSVSWDGWKVGGTSARQKIYRKYFGLNWQLWRHKHWNMTSLPIHRVKVQITFT